MKTFTDPRDGETYRIVKIGNLLWFAENLKYQGVPHHFPDRDSDNVQKYGCLYNWENAKLACPEGWRLPTKTDFHNLLSYIDNHKSNNSTKFLSLIANSKVWKDYSNKGLNEFGFGALPAGYRFSDGNIGGFGFQAVFWSATLCRGSLDVYILNMYSDFANMGSIFVNYAIPVRCVKEV